MTKQINKKFLVTLLIFISFILFSAFIIEHRLGHQPCKLCLYERIPYFLSVLLIIKIFFISTYERETLLILSLVFIISTCLAFYHFGIEQGFFKESLVCNTENSNNALSAEDLLKKLKKDTVSCKDVTFTLFGFSLATFNTVISIVISAIMINIFINYDKNR